MDDADDDFFYEPPLFLVSESMSGETDQLVSFTNPDTRIPRIVSEGRKCLPIFTDYDLATRFSREANCRHPVIAKFETWGAVYNVVMDSMLFGYDHVAFDAGKRTRDPVDVQAIQEVLRHVEKHLGQ
jgi:hypothetical protein